MPRVRRHNPTLLAFRALVALGLAFFPLLQAPAAPTTFPSSANSTGQTEEEKSEEVKSVAGCATPVRGDRKPPTPPDERPVVTPSRIPDSSPGAALPRAASADPFRNGLGCPFRC
jgi:hypothetical protein